ncbi:MAG: glucose 1-dehydrogenase [Actinomycetota bacterium]|nr:glucose 1-dehydrogenase [Actinomycetota bacterium]
MTERLNGKVAVVTGAASGIGEAIVKRFAEEGARIVIGDIQPELGEGIIAEIDKDAVYAHCDVTIESDVESLLQTAVQTFGRIDILVNNAGIVGARGPISEIPTEEYYATMDVLLAGTFFGMKHAARIMQPQGSGSIVNLASTAGVQGGLGPHVYAAAKHAVVGLTKNVAAELCRYGIRVNCIAPGSTATPLVAKAHLDDHNALDEVEQRLKRLSPVKDRPGMPIDVANAALYLASEESGNTNGHCLVVDGGLTTGSSAEDPPYSELLPFMRESGKTGI